jgi:hypothetical protein
MGGSMGVLLAYIIALNFCSCACCRCVAGVVGACVLLLGARRHGRAHRVRGGSRVARRAELEARRAWPAAAGGGARFGARTRDAVLAPRPLPPRAPRRAGAAERAAAGHT